MSRYGKHTSDSAFRSSERLVSSICLYHRPFFVSTMACCTIWLHRSFRFSVLNATTIFYQFVLASRVWIIRQQKGFLQALFCIQPKTQARFSKKEVNSHTSHKKNMLKYFILHSESKRKRACNSFQRGGGAKCAYFFSFPFISSGILCSISTNSLDKSMIDTRMQSSCFSCSLLPRISL